MRPYSGAWQVLYVLSAIYARGGTTNALGELMHLRLSAIELNEHNESVRRVEGNQSKSSLDVRFTARFAR